MGGVASYESQDACVNVCALVDRWARIQEVEKKSSPAKGSEELSFLKACGKTHNIQDI